MRHIFIINPAAGRKDRSDEISRLIRQACEQAGISPHIHITARPGHAVQLVREAALSFPGETLRFYACGGDGTLNEVARGAALLPGAEVAHFPCGTGNDFIKIFGKDAPSFSDLPRLIGGVPFPVDLIRLGEDSYALNICSMGLDAKIAADLPKYKRLPFLRGIGPYFLSALRHLMGRLHAPYRIVADGVDYSGSYTLLAVANGQFYGGGFHAVPEADPADGWLDLLLAGAMSPFTAAKILGPYKDGRHREFPKYIRWIRCKKALIEAAGGAPAPFSADGEISFIRGMDMEIAEKGLTFIIPRNIRIVVRDIPPDTPK